MTDAELPRRIEGRDGVSDERDEAARHEVRPGPGSAPNYWEVYRRGEGPVLFCGDDGERRARAYAEWIDGEPGTTGYEVAAGWRDRFRAAEARVKALEAERDAYASAALAGLAGLVGTPEKGYVKDGGPGLLRDDMRRMRAKVKALEADARRLDWLDRRRVLVMRCRAPVHDDAWKVETMTGPYIRPALRDAIDLAMEMSGQPEKDA
jgi:hypothetical protein